MKISKIASMLLIGSMTVMLIGCGDDDDSSSSSSSSSSTSGTALASYRADANIIAVGDKNTTAKTGTNGGFSVNTPANFKYIQITGGTNADTHASVTYIAKAPKGYTKYPSALTTLLVTESGEVNTTLAEKLKDIINVDYNRPEVNPEVVQKAMVLKSVVEVALAKEGDISKIASVVKDVNLSDANLTNVAINLVNNMATIVPEVAEVNDSVQKIAEVNVSDTNATTELSNALSAAEGNITTATAKLGLNSIKFGNKKAILSDLHTFNPVTITYTNDDEGNLTDFYNIAFDLNEADIQYLPADLNTTFDVNLSIVIKEKPRMSEEDRNVTLKIKNAQLTLNTDKNATNPIKIKFVAGTTTVYASASSDLTAVHNYVHGGTTAHIHNTITNTDLNVSLNTLLDDLSSSSNSDKIKGAIDALNTYLKTNNAYNVNVKLEANKTLSDKLLTSWVSGSVMTSNGTNHAPVINSIKTIVNETEVTDINESSECSLEANVTDPDGNPLTVTYSIDGNGSSLYEDNDGIFETTLSTGSVTANTSKTITVKACDSFGECTTQNHVITVVNSIEDIVIPAEADKVLEVNSSDTSESADNVTLNYVAGDAIKVNYAAVNADPSNSSQIITVKDSNGDVIATLSPDDSYDGKTFYFTYNGVVKSGVYDKTQEVIVQY